MPDDPEATELMAGPPAPNPPLTVAIVLVALSLAAPFLFLRAGAGSVLFGVMTLALAAAGLIALQGAVVAQKRRLADASIRARARIGPAGITFYPRWLSDHAQHFPLSEIEAVHLLATSLVVQTAATHPKPGRHTLRFGRLATPRDQLLAALAAAGMKG